jgi:hypothetical protein
MTPMTQIAPRPYQNSAPPRARTMLLTTAAREATGEESGILAKEPPERP